MGIDTWDILQMSFWVRPKKWELVLSACVFFVSTLVLFDVTRWAYRLDFIYNSLIKNQKTINLGLAGIPVRYPWYVKKSKPNMIYLASVPPPGVDFCGIVVISSGKNCVLRLNGDNDFQCIDSLKNAVGKRYPFAFCRSTNSSENIEFWCLERLNLGVDVRSMPQACRPQFSSLLESIAFDATLRDSLGNRSD